MSIDILAWVAITGPALFGSYFIGRAAIDYFRS